MRLNPCMDLQANNYFAYCPLPTAYYLVSSGEFFYSNFVLVKLTPLYPICLK